jgi:hypothetical protein
MLLMYEGIEKAPFKLLGDRLEDLYNGTGTHFPFAYNQLYGSNHVTIIAKSWPVIHYLSLLLRLIMIFLVIATRNKNLNLN